MIGDVDVRENEQPSTLVRLDGEEQHNQQNQHDPHVRDLQQNEHDDEQEDEQEDEEDDDYVDEQDNEQGKTQEDEQPHSMGLGGPQTIVRAPPLPKGSRYERCANLRGKFKCTLNKPCSPCVEAGLGY